MAKGQRRTIEQLIEDKKKELAELEAKAKAKSALSADHKAIKTIVADIEKVGNDLGVAAKDILKLVSSVIAPRQPRTPK